MTVHKESSPPASDRINLADQANLDNWCKRLNVTEMQLRDAVAEVGDQAGDVEMHLKGTRSSTNDDKVERTS
ncbi:DUF3606 domain-containing protein [Ottowia sp. GY511]|uniref:DUF3606 domain-containing protein n=1 Tax=Ottowia flava TaxID=2675430 RepID=A0ABW4KXJ4_9BURK|nr:DUF3606 domain-containing protein [Ottowia sp. GY511]TXK23418.1 DUF3606 domain-containing protein [Ottowia sp. GY511]